MASSKKSQTKVGSSEQEHFTHGMHIAALILASDVKIESVMFYEGINANVFRRSIAFAIAAVVTSRSSSFEYTISIHAVRAGVVRNVCNSVVSTETTVCIELRIGRFLEAERTTQDGGSFNTAKVGVSLYLTL